MAYVNMAYIVMAYVGRYSYRRTLESKGVLLFKKGVSMMEVDVKYRDNKHWNLEGRSCCS